MTRKVLFAGLGVITACLVGWAALAGAQSVPGDPPPPPAPVPLKAETSPPPPAGIPGIPPVEEKASPIPPPGVGTPPPPAVVPPPPVVVPPPVSKDEPTAPPTVMPKLEPPKLEAPTAAKPFTPAEDKAEVSVTPDNPTGKQEPAVSIEWIGTPSAKVGTTADYSLVVRNICNIPVQQVALRVRIPVGLTVAATEPRAVTEAGGMLMWDLGSLMAKQERVLQLKLQADTKGDVTPQAWVTFTGSSAMRIRVREPKLLVKCGVQEKVLVGDPAAFTLTVSNPGDGSADQVKIRATLSEGLEHARGNKIDFDIGSLAPGESRNVTLLCATRVGGAQKCEASVESDGGLKATDTGTVNVIMPRLDLQLSGPRLRYLERKAIYSLKVTNPGDAAATNVTVADMVPAGFKVLAASDGGRHDFQTRTVSWFLGEIGPGQSREVKVEVQAINPGDHEHKASAVGARGLRADSKLMTKVEGLAALLVEMVDTEDPIEAGGDTGFEVRVTNTGSKAEGDIKLVATVPDKMQFKNAQGPVKYQQEGNRIVFEPIEKLAPRADAIFRINVKAMESGIARFKIQVSSASMTDPVMKEEATRIYTDAPEAGSTPPPATVTPPAATPPATIPPPALPGGLPKLPGSGDTE